jgi:hypothetical protein
MNAAVAARHERAQVSGGVRPGDGFLAGHSRRAALWPSSTGLQRSRW